MHTMVTDGKVLVSGTPAGKLDKPGESVVRECHSRIATLEEQKKYGIKPTSPEIMEALADGNFGTMLDAGVPVRLAFEQGHYASKTYTKERFEKAVRGGLRIAELATAFALAESTILFRLSHDGLRGLYNKLHILDSELHKGTKHKGTEHKGTEHKGTKHKGTKQEAKVAVETADEVVPARANVVSTPVNIKCQRNKVCSTCRHNANDWRTCVHKGCRGAVNGYPKWEGTQVAEKPIVDAVANAQKEKANMENKQEVVQEAVQPTDNKQPVINLEPVIKAAGNSAQDVDFKPVITAVEVALMDIEARRGKLMCTLHTLEEMYNGVSKE